MTYIQVWLDTDDTIEQLMSFFGYDEIDEFLAFDVSYNLLRRRGQSHSEALSTLSN